MTNFWLNDPNVLLNKKNIMELWPNNNFDLARKLNAITRTIIVLTILGYFLTKSIKILVSAIVSLIVLVIIYKTKSVKKTKEGFTNINEKSKGLTNLFQTNFTMPTKKNPVMNVLMDEYKYNTNRKKAAPIYNDEILEKVNDNVKSHDPKLYRNLGDNLTFANSMRNFYSMPNTTIPNKQKEFALFCYGNMPSCKEGNALQCSKNNVELRRS
tara:strand:- start:609 stop:1244 length:636 start_codon:yes stop_codon:yes gene_type:complete